MDIRLGSIVGPPRSGRSRELYAVAQAAAARGVTVWHADPRGGESNPALWRMATRAAGTLPEIRAMLRDAGEPDRRPAGELLVAVEEASDLAGDTAQLRLMLLAAAARREGWPVWIIATDLLDPAGSVQGQEEEG